MEPHLKYEVQFRLADQLQFQLARLRHLVVLGTILGFFFASMALFSYGSLDVPGTILFAITLLITIPASIFGIFLAGFVSSLATMRLLPEVMKNHTYTLDEVGMRFADGAGNVAIHPWAQIKTVRETPAGFLINVGGRILRWIPRRAFSVSDTKAFRAYLRSRVANVVLGDS